MICGVDVSKQTREVRVEQEGPGGSFANSQEGIAQRVDFCRAQQVHLVAMEASGGYEKLPFALLWAEEIAVTIVNPRAVRRFAEGMGYLEKTDALDAGVIAHFARTKKSKPCSPASAQEQHLRALVTRLRQLTEVHGTEQSASFGDRQHGAGVVSADAGVGEEADTRFGKSHCAVDWSRSAMAADGCQFSHH
jgi:transposase